MRHGHDPAAGDGVVEGSRAGGEPPGLADGGLDFPAESGRGSGGGFVERVAVGFAEAAHAPKMNASSIPWTASSSAPMTTGGPNALRSTSVSPA